MHSIQIIAYLKGPAPESRVYHHMLCIRLAQISQANLLSLSKGSTQHRPGNPTMGHLESMGASWHRPCACAASVTPNARIAGCTSQNATTSHKSAVSQHTNCVSEGRLLEQLIDIIVQAMHVQYFGKQDAQTKSTQQYGTGRAVLYLYVLKTPINRTLIREKAASAAHS